MMSREEWEAMVARLKGRSKSLLGPRQPLIDLYQALKVIGVEHDWINPLDSFWHKDLV